MRETGFAVEDGRLYYALVLANDMADTTVEFPRVRVSFYDEEGELIAADESVRLAICPGQEMAWASDIWHIDETPASVEAEVVTPRSRDFVNDVTLCAPLEVRAATIDQSGDAATLTCEIYNPNSFETPSAYVTILYRDSEGALLCGETPPAALSPQERAYSLKRPWSRGLCRIRSKYSPASAEALLPHEGPAKAGAFMRQAGKAGRWAERPESLQAWGRKFFGRRKQKLPPIFIGAIFAFADFVRALRPSRRSGARALSRRRSFAAGTEGNGQRPSELGALGTYSSSVNLKKRSMFLRKINSRVSSGTCSSSMIWLSMRSHLTVHSVA